MNDDQIPELELLAVSASLDGEATPEERELVESSPALRAMLAEWRALRDGGGEIVVPDDRRDVAIAAALTVFDELRSASPQMVAASTAASSSETTNVVRFERRRRQYRLVGGAAAALVFVFGGLALLQGGGDDSSDLDAGASIETQAKQAPADDEPAVAMEAPASADESMTGMAPAATEAPAPLEAPADTEAPAAAETAETAEAAEAAEAAPETAAVDDSAVGDTTPASTLPVVDDSEELVEYYATARMPAPTPTEPMPMTDPTSCPLGTDVLIGEVSYRGVTALVVLSADGSTLRAVDSTTCAVLLTTTP